jgi:hypothetical protein
LETPKRLQPLPDTLRRLYTLSGNQCAYPQCCKLMFNDQGNFVGQICHIEAASPGGERFNPNMTNESRRAYDNLMLMCYEHHIETNKVQIYPVRKMKEIKSLHEEAVNSYIDGVVQKMQSSITDVTSLASVITITSLANLYIEVYGKDTREKEFIDEDVTAFNSAIKKLSRLSPDAKKIFALSLDRAHYEENLYGGLNKEKIFVDPNEMQRATKLNSRDLYQIFQEIDRAGFLSFDTLDNGLPVFWIFIQGTEANLWEMIRQFCYKKSFNIVDMVDNLDFSVLD